MKIADIMTPYPHACRVNDTLEQAARLMWDNDCGSLPITDRWGNVVGMLTDRDICMAAYTQGRPLREIPVTIAASASIHSVPPDASLAHAYHVMKMHRVRRLPVIDSGGNLVGLVSLGDIVRRARLARGLDADLDAQPVMAMLAEVCRSNVPHVAAMERAQAQPELSAIGSSDAISGEQS